MIFNNNQTKIYIYKIPKIDSRMYIIPNSKYNTEALVIDPSIQEDAIPLIRNFSSVRILLTHSHYDHISGVNWLRELTKATLLCTEICAEKIKDPHQNLAAFAPALYIGCDEEYKQICQNTFQLNYYCKADKIYPPELYFTFGNHQIQTVQTPGHSPCSQCIILTPHADTNSKIIFTGDSMVNGHKIITRLPGGSKKAYLETTKPFLDAIDNDTIIMPGNGDWGKKSEM